MYLGMISAAEYSQKYAVLEAENSSLKSGNSQLKAQVDKSSVRIEELSAQVKWFQKQLFGQKSERRVGEPSKEQLFLGDQFQKETDKEETRTVKEHERKKQKTRSTDGDDQNLFFDESVPVEVIKIELPEVEGLSEDEYEVIGQKITHRLGQRPGVYFIMKFVRDVIKMKGDKKDKPKILCPPLLDPVFEKSHADVSFLAGLLIDKFQYHLPLYRQHQRLESAGIKVSRAWLTQLVHRCGNLLEPIFNALVESIRGSRVKLMDETPIKAGRKKKGKMRIAYFWPVMGGEKEIAFLYFDSREHHHVFEALGAKPEDGSVIVSDGYGAYKAYAEATDTLNAQCWTHSRREFVKAEDAEPKKAKEALDLIRPLYRIEEEIKEQELEGDEKLIYRVLNSRPVVDKFFAWVSKQIKDGTLLPTNRLTKALNYVDKRREALSIFLTDPDVPMDTNELERALRVIPMGRKNWLFCWTEVGAKYVGIFQSLIVTCKMHDINPYTYLVDVLQRVAYHPKADIHQLTPGQWKNHFAHDPFRAVPDVLIPKNH
jgi:transposase